VCAHILTATSHGFLLASMRIWRAENVENSGGGCGSTEKPEVGGAEGSILFI